MDKIRLGFIGCGEHATRDLYPVLCRVADLELIATCDRNEVKARRNARRFGAESYYTDHETLLRREDLDAVMIVGPPDMHFEIGMACLESGRHIFVEKPSASTLEQARALAETAEKVGKYGQVGHFMRHASGHQLAKRIIESEEFGSPSLIEGKYFTNGPWEPRKKWGLSDLEWTYMLVQGVHLIDISRYFMGEIATLESRRFVNKSGRPSFSVAMQFESGASGALSFSASSPAWQSRIEIIGDKCSHVKVDNGMSLTYASAHKWAERFAFDEPELALSYEGGASYKSKPAFGYFGEIQHFVESLRSNSSPTPNLWDAYNTLVVADAIIAKSNVYPNGT